MPDCYQSLGTLSDWSLSLTLSRNAIVVGRGALLAGERGRPRLWNTVGKAGLKHAPGQCLEMDGWGQSCQADACARQVLPPSLCPAHKVPAVGDQWEGLLPPGERTDQVHLWHVPRAEILAFYCLRMLRVFDSKCLSQGV